MPEIPNRNEFEPDHQSRKSWLSTRKQQQPFQLPGFYNTIDYGKDSNWVILAACVESAAVVLTIYGGYSKGGIFLYLSIIAVVLFLVFDVVGATLLHSPTAEKCMLRNKIRVEKNPLVQESSRRELKRCGMFAQIIGILLIVTSAFTKILAILLLGKLITIFYVIMALLYLIVIYIHIAHTGFFLAEWNTAKMFKKQHDKWLAANNRGFIVGGNIPYAIRDNPKPKSIFECEVKLFNMNDFKDKITVQNHSITFISQKNEKVEQTKGGNKIQVDIVLFKYEIESTGILIDEDITGFTGGQGTIGSNIIAEECLKHQINYFA